MTEGDHGGIILLYKAATMKLVVHALRVITLLTSWTHWKYQRTTMTSCAQPLIASFQLPQCQYLMLDLIIHIFQSSHNLLGEAQKLYVSQPHSGNHPKRPGQYWIDWLNFELQINLGLTIDHSTHESYTSTQNSYITFCCIHGFDIKPT